MTRKKDLVSSPRGLDDEERDEEVKEETERERGCRCRVQSSLE